MNSFNYVQQSLADCDIGSVITSFIRYILFCCFGEVHEARLYYMLIIVFCFAVWRKISGMFSKNKLVNIVVPLFCILNPLFLNRLVLGNHKLLLGFTIMSYAAALVLEFIYHKRSETQDVTRLWLKVMVFTLISGIFAPHTLPLLLILFIILGIVYHKDLVSGLRKFFGTVFQPKYGAAVLLLIVLGLLTAVNLYGSWQEMQGFGSGDLEMFAPVSDANYGLLLNLTNFFGMWVEGGAMTSAKTYLSGWWLIGGFIMQLIVLVAWIRLKNKENKRMALVMGITFLTSVFLALGLYTGIDLLQYPFKLLYESGIIRGLRETTKFLSLAFVPFMVLLVTGLDWLWQSRHKFLKLFSTAIIIIYLSANLLAVINLGRGTVAACEYPQSAIFLQQQFQDNEKVLLVPEASGDYYKFCDTLTHNVFMLFKTNPVAYALDTTEDVYFNSQDIADFKATYGVSYIYVLKTSLQNISLDSSACSLYSNDAVSILCKIK